MAILQEQAAELADLLPDDMWCGNARERLLCLLYMLLCLTDENHVLSNADLRAVFRARFGDERVPSENTLAADLRAIGHSEYLGIGLHVTPSGVWCERTQLTPAKVRLLLNAVQSSRTLTTSQSYELQEDLINLVSRHQEDGLMAEVHVDQRVHKEAQRVLATIDVVAEAMRAGRKIEFEYTYSDFRGRPHALEGDQGGTLRCETPVALYYSEGNYYVETYSANPWRHGIELLVSRADRMVGTCVSEELADKNRTVSNARRSARKRMESEFEMVGGPLRNVFLRVRADATNGFFDRFGYGAKFGQFEGTLGEPDATGLTLVRVAQAFTFYRWLSSLGDGMVIVEPPAEIGLRSGPWANKLKGVSRDELMEDYVSMREGFLAYLDSARAPYVS